MNQEHSHEGGGDTMVKTIWRVFWLMLAITIIEIVGALFYPATAPRMVLNVFFVVMSMLKAFYIVGTFMHLKFEVKHMMLTILIPTIFLIYALAIMLAEGTSWYELQAPLYK